MVVTKPDRTTLRHLTSTQVLDDADILAIRAGNYRRYALISGWGWWPTSGRKERNHIVSGLRTRAGLRTLLGLLAALGLVAALTMPAMASHEDDFTLVAVNLENTDECEGADFAFKLDDMDQIHEAGVYTASD